jgi:hypothetical protein
MDYRGDFSTLVEKKKGIKPHLGLWLSGLITFNTPREFTNTLWVKCVSEVAYTESGEFMQCTMRQRRVTT